MVPLQISKFCLYAKNSQQFVWVYKLCHFCVDRKKSFLNTREDGNRNEIVKHGKLVYL